MLEVKAQAKNTELDKSASVSAAAKSKTKDNEQPAYDDKLVMLIALFAHGRC